MDRPKRHHIVPSSYLKRFAEEDSGLVYILDLKKREIRKQKPEKIMSIKDYYRQKHAPEGVDENVLEKTFGSFLEAEAKPAIDKLIDDPRELNEKDIAILLSYLHFQRIRVPRQIDQFKDFFQAYVESIAYSIPEIAKDLADGRYEIVIKEEAKFGFMKHMKDLYIRAFSRMIWKVSEAPRSTPLVTTDSPVSLVHPEFPPPLEAGIGLLGTLVLYPLSPTHLLELSHPEMDGSSKSNFMDEVPIRELEEVSHLMVKSGGRLTDEMTCATNMILARLTDRFVVANNEPILLKLLQDLTCLTCV
jgi:hypothetical protein